MRNYPTQNPTQKPAPASFEAGAGGFLSRLGGRRPDRDGRWAVVAHGRVVWRVWRALCGVLRVRLCVGIGGGLKRLERIVERRARNGISHNRQKKNPPFGGRCLL